MKIHEAARKVLINSNAPMTPKEIYEEITKNQLFTFGAKDPVAVLKQTLRKKSQGSEAIFKQTDDKKYTII